jgi:hypothetical protein
MSELPSPPVRKRTSFAAKLMLTGIGLSLAAAGLLFSNLLWKAYQRAAETHRWTETPCQILDSSIEEVRKVLSLPPQYEPKITYIYTVNEENFQNNQLRRVPGQSFKKKSDAEEVIKRYPAGQGALCYVNPDDPKTAILQRETKAALYTIWFPLLFVVGGLGMVIHIWWPEGAEVEAAATENA